MSYFNRQSNQSSKFWLDFDSLGKTVDVLTGKVSKKADLVKLISVRRSIANFVRIVTGKDIPVTFSSGNQSYTNGEKVVISAQISNDDFDPTVGLALHEASHCLLTDFKTLPKLVANPPAKLVDRVKNERGLDYLAAKAYVSNYMKDLTNIIEDRRIDNYIFKNAPGYKGYYHALYNKYFNDPIVDKGLLSATYRKENWESYIFRIANLTNANKSLTALKGLQEIWDLIDLKNIGRFNDTKQIVQLAEEVFNIIENNIPQAPPKSTEDQESDDTQDGDGKAPNGQDGEQQESDDNNENGTAPKGSGDEDSDDDEDQDDEDQDGSGGSGDEDSDLENEDIDGDGDGADASASDSAPAELSKSDVDALKKAIAKQQQFIDGQIEKEDLNQTEESQMEAVEKADASYEQVAHAMGKAHGSPDGQKVMVAKKLTRQLIESRVFDDVLAVHANSEITEAVAAGMRMGAILGKKLQVRQEVRDTKFTRQNVGKIDRRLIAQAGAGIENIFEQTFVSKYNPSIIHISIDASGSMGGSRFKNSIKCAVAIAKACSMIENLDCVISTRGTADIPGNSSVPAVLIAYDSRVDSINKIVSLFPHLECNCSTPEGLCFEAIMKMIPAGSATLQSYFVNFSDGSPGFSGASFRYSGDSALQHTKKQVQRMREKNIKVISYFIDGHNMDDFKVMYGRDSQFIDTNNIPAVAKTMNAKFLEG